MGHLPIMYTGNKSALAAICLHMSYMFAISMKEKSAENVVKAYLSGMLAHNGRSVAISSDNGIEFQNKVLNGVYDQLCIKRLFSNLFHLHGNATVENVHNFLK